MNNQYYNPIAPMQPVNNWEQQPMQMMQPQNQQVAEPPIIVIPVNGEQAARNYPVQRGRTIFLIDFNTRKFWIKSIKPNGLEDSCEGYTFTSDAQPQQPQIQNQIDFNNFVTRDEFNMLKTSLEELMK